MHHEIVSTKTKWPMLWLSTSSVYTSMARCIAMQCNEMQLNCIYMCVKHEYGWSRTDAIHFPSLDVSFYTETLHPKCWASSIYYHISTCSSQKKIELFLILLLLISSPKMYKNSEFTQFRICIYILHLCVTTIWKSRIVRIGCLL